MPAPVPSSGLPVRVAQRLIEEIFIPAAAYVPPSAISAAMPKPQPTASAPPVPSRLANLSDFAFWDAMPFDESDMPAVAAVAISVLPQIETPAGGVVSRYRIIEWRHGRSAEAQQSVAVAPLAVTAPVSEPVAPIAAPMPQFAPPTAPAAISSRIAIETALAVVAVPEPVVPVVALPAVDAPTVAPVEASPARAAATRLQVTPLRDRPASPALMEWRAAPPADGEYQLPPRELLQEPVARTGVIMTQETLERNAGLLESVLEDFGVKGEIIHVRPGPVVTLYEFEPAPGVKSSRVIGLADDIARSMSALSARVAVVPGRNVIGIELPNASRETVYFREMIDSDDFTRSGFKLALGLGKTIGGEPVIAELAKMPHLLVAGTTGSGKSVAINTMILSLALPHDAAGMPADHGRSEDARALHL